MQRLGMAVAEVGSQEGASDHHHDLLGDPDHQFLSAALL